MSNENNCAICFDLLCSSQSPIGIINSCGHVFHKGCFNQWEETNRKRQQRSRDYWDDEDVIVKCPTCNSHSKGFIQIYLNLSNLPSVVDLSSDDEEEEEEEEGKESNENNESNQDQNQNLDKTKKLQQYKYKIQMLKKQNESLKSTLEEYKDLQQKYTAIQQEQTTLVQEVKECRLTLCGLSSDNNKLHMEMREKDNSIQNLKDERNDLKSKLAQIQLVLDRKIREVKERNQGEIALLMNDHKSCQKNRDEFRDICQQQEKEIMSLRKECDELRKKLYGTTNVSGSLSNRQSNQNYNYNIDSKSLSTKVPNKKVMKRAIEETMDEFKLHAEVEEQKQKVYQLKQDHKRLMKKSSEQAKRMKQAFTVMKSNQSKWSVPGVPGITLVASATSSGRYKITTNNTPKGYGNTDTTQTMQSQRPRTTNNTNASSNSDEEVEVMKVVDNGRITNHNIFDTSSSTTRKSTFPSSGRRPLREMSSSSMSNTSNFIQGNSSRNEKRSRPSLLKNNDIRSMFQNRGK